MVGPSPVSPMLIIDKEMKEARKAAAERQASSSDPERQKYITEQAKERAAQKAQKARILAEIENDKAERKVRAEREKQASLGTGHANTSINNPASGNRNTTNTATRPSTNITATGTSRSTGLTKLSIRQPDSKTLKVEFETNKTLEDVRKWIDTNRTDGSSPYVLQTTFPTRTFEVSEERETVGSIFGKGGQCVMKVSPYPTSFLSLHIYDSTVSPSIFIIPSLFPYSHHEFYPVYPTASQVFFPDFPWSLPRFDSILRTDL